MIFFKKKHSRFGGEINPDDIFLDSSNLPNFDTQQFEGMIEKPISKKTFFILGFFFSAVLLIFLGKLYFLQIRDGENYLAKSENNRLYRVTIFADRGIIYDRNGEELAWNSVSEEGNTFAKRNYTNLNGLSGLLGYVGYPLKDKSGNFFEFEISGKDGVEKIFNNRLKGKNGLKIAEIDALMDIKSESTIEYPKNGENLTITIDSGVQNYMYDTMDALANKVGFKGGAGIIMNVETGEILSLVSYPEYSSDIMTNSNDRSEITKYLKDPRNPFLNRPSVGLYTPGSIVKPFVSLAALTEKIISPEKQILSTGSISIKNPYNPELKTVFKDWKAHGWVDMRRAIAVSSDVYFYAVGGGYEDQKGLGITKIAKYMKVFGFGSKTGAEVLREEEGLVPDPAWKKEVFGEDWYLGNTYHTSIGQYGFQVTPLQAIRAIASIANNGKLITPVLVAGDKNKNPVKISGISQSSFNVVKEGMRKVVTEGTSQGLSVPYVKVAAKSGTAELGAKKDRVNSWITGFFPYEKPKYAFVVIMESGPVSNTVGGLYVMRQTLDWMSINRPEYFE